MRDNLDVQETFGIVIFAVVGVAVVVGVISLVGRSGLYDQIGRGGLSLNEDQPRPSGQNVSTGTARLERDEEIRQMLDARNERRARRGQPPLDVQAELDRLTVPAVDQALAAEVRSLVIARNERRARAGKPALDVEAEVTRQLTGLDR